MPDQNAITLNQVIELIKKGEKSQARQLLLEFLKANRYNEQAWLYMAACAASKAEFESSITKVLTLNPLNGQALNLAKKHKIELPEAAKLAAQPKKKKAQRSGGASRGRRLLRVLLLLLIIAGIGGAAFVYLTAQEDTEDGESAAEATTPETTEEASAATPTPTREAIVVPTVGPTLDPPHQSFVEMTILSGQGDESELQAKPAYLPNEQINAVVELLDYAGPIQLSFLIEAQDGSSAVNASHIVQPDDPRRVVVPFTPDRDVWTNGVWFVRLSIGDVNVAAIPFRIEPEGGLPPTPEQEVTEEETPEPTEEPAEQALEASPEPDTETLEPTATLEPTDESAVPTQTPTRAAVVIPTVAVTPVPTNTPTPEPENSVRLTYNDEILYLMNLTDANLDISGLRFVQVNLDGAEIDFDAVNWQQGNFTDEGSVYALEPGSCFQLGIREILAVTKPDECERLSQWRTAGVPILFWIQRARGAETFTVYLDDEPLTECEIAAGVCEFPLPQ